MKQSGIRFGLDVGKVRTGIARSDASGTIVIPHAVVLTEKLAAELPLLIEEYQPVVFYVGLPIDLQGVAGIAAQDIQARVNAVFEGIDTPHEYVDERMTTKIAESRLRTLEHSSADMRSKLDAMAAVVLLEDALERERRGVEGE
jgi:putative Holliday junction resolvase